MSHPKNNQMGLKEAERQAFQLSSSQDGLYDIFIGTYIALLSATPWLDENGLRIPWNVILVWGLGILVLIGVLLLKKFIVAPRIGQVRHGRKRKQRMKRLAVGMGIIFLLTVVLFGITVSAIYFREPIFTGSFEGSLPLDIVHTAAGIFIFVIFSVIGFMNDYPRMYFYGFLFGMGYVTSTALQDITGNPFYWPWTFAGLVAAAIGLMIFIRFLRDYPLPQETLMEANS